MSHQPPQPPAPPTAADQAAGILIAEQHQLNALLLHDLHMRWSNQPERDIVTIGEGMPEQQTIQGAPRATWRGLTIQNPTRKTIHVGLGVGSAIGSPLIVPPLSGLTWAGNFSDISVAVSAADALLATESLVILKLPYPPAQPMSFPLAAGELYNPATNNVEVQRTPTIYVPFTAKKTGETLWTPAAGKRFRLLGWTIFATLECTGEFKDEAGETGILVPFEKKTATNSPPGIFNGYMSAKAGNKLVITLTGGAGVTGYVFGTEE